MEKLPVIDFKNPNVLDETVCREKLNPDSFDVNADL
jgi:hypothetical protein